MTPPNGSTTAAHDIAADLLARGFAPIPFLLTRSERTELELRPMGRFTHSGPDPAARVSPAERFPLVRARSPRTGVRGQFPCAITEWAADPPDGRSSCSSSATIGDAIDAAVT